MELESLYNWFMGLGEPYGVNPVIFGSIYIGAIPFFWVALYWLARNIRRKKPVAGPVLMACSCAVSSYIYLIIVGKNVPGWVYGLVAIIIVYAIYSTLKKVNQKKASISGEKPV